MRTDRYGFNVSFLANFPFSSGGGSRK